MSGYMNKNEYKRIMSGVRPSAETVERIMDMTNDNKGFNFSRTFKKVASATLALAVLLGGGFGVNTAVQKNNADKPLSIMVAYAGDNGKLHFGKKSRQPIFYGIYVAPANDKKASKEAYNRWNADTQKVYAFSDERDKNESATYGRGGYPCCNSAGEETAYFYTLQGGEFSLTLEDYTDVKSFKVENKSRYGTLNFEYTTKEATEFAEWQEEQYKKYNANGYEDLPESVQQEIERRGGELMGLPEGADENFDLQAWEREQGLGHEYILTGDEIRYTQSVGYGERGLGKYHENKGYSLEWEASDDLADAIGNDTSFDLSQIKDTIIFTVVFNNGEVKTASLDIYFDSDGYMHCAE